MSLIDKLIHKLVSKLDLSETGNSTVDNLQNKMLDMYNSQYGQNIGQESNNVEKDDLDEDNTSEE